MVRVPVLFSMLLMSLATALNAAPVSHAIAMHGTPKYPADFAHFDYVNPDAPKGGQVRLAATGSFDSLNPFIVKGESATGLGTLFDTLLTSSADEAFTEYGLLAETVEMPDDRSWVIFNLRPEARWADGEPVTADDVVFTFETILRDGAPGLQYYYQSVASVERLDTHKVRFTFAEGDNREMPLIVGQQSILPKHWWASRDFTVTTLEPPLGSGPYVVDSLDPGRYIAYRRNPDYWGRDLPVNVGIHNFDLLRYDYYRDATVQIEAFKGGEFDYRSENSSKFWATAYEIDALKEGLLRKAEIGHDQAAGMQGYVYNTRRPLFTDRRVRQALAFAFDFEFSNKTLFYGQYRRSRSYFDNSELAATGLPSAGELELLEPYRDRLPPELFTTEYQPPATDGSGAIRANLKQAVQLLAEAGWTMQGGKLVGPDGGPFEFEILLVSPLFERITLPFTKNLERLGITASVRLVDSAQYLQRLESSDFDMIVFSWGQSLSPGNEQRNFWSTDAASRPGSRNFAGIQDPVIDALIEQVIAAPDREALVTRTRALDRVLQWGYYVIPHWHIDYDRLVFWNKFGMPDKVPSSGSVFGTWWVEPELEAKLRGRIKSVPR